MSIKDLLDGIPGLSGSVRSILLKELEQLAATALVNNAAKVAAQVILKGIDGTVATAVKHLPADQAARLAHEFATEVVGQQYDQLMDAFKAYVPLQLAVEVAKKAHGGASPEANAARAARAAGIAELRQEMQDLLLAVTGKTPTD